MRPTIYIGLGGTGIRAIAHAKKLYEDVYGKGNIPKHIAFMAMDFNLADINSTELPTSLEDDAVKIPQTGSPRQHYIERSKQGAYKWVFPEGNPDSIADAITDGAGQVRTTGRFYTEFVLPNIEASLKQCWLQVSNLSYVDENGKSVPCNTIDVHIAMSLAGGTGAGSFLNIAELIKRNYGGRVHLFGYGVLHGVFREQDPYGNHTPKVRVNAYSSIVDLDYLMHASTSNPVKIKINGRDRELDSPIFNEFFVIDNVTTTGQRVPTVDDLCEALGTCLFSSSGDLGSKIQGGQSNNRWQMGNYNILHKRGWAQTLGGMQVVYKGEDLARMYGYKAAIELIRKMRQESAGMEKVVTDWLESADVREDCGFDLLTDQIYSRESFAKIKDPKVDIQDSIQSIKTTVEKYLGILPEFPEEEAIQQIKNEKLESLKAKLVEVLSGDGCIANAKKFLSTLLIYIECCKNEMEQEVTALKAKLESGENYRDKLNGAIKKYEEYCNKLFKTAKGKQEKLDVVSATAKGMLKLALEIKRREVAKGIFVALKSKIEEYEKQIKGINEQLEVLNDSYSLALNNARFVSSRLFEYDLSASERANMPFDAEDVGVVSFIANSKLGFLDGVTVEELKAAIDSYSATLPAANAYRNKRLIDVINGLSQKEYDLLKDAIAAKSSSLLPINDRGQVNDAERMPSQLMVREFLISLYCEPNESCRLQNDKAFVSMATANAGCKFIPNPCEALRQKMFIFRAEYAMIPYCIDLFDDAVVDEYNTQVVSATSGQATFNPHFDKILFEKMRLENFQLKPELPNEALFYWVCGQIFGYHDVVEECSIMEKDKEGTPLRKLRSEEVVHRKYIRNLKGKYYFWQEDSEDNGKNKKWYPIGGISTGDRLKAFENFKAIILPEYKTELKSLLSSIVTDLGEARIKAKLRELRGEADQGSADYIDLVLCTDKNSATYYSQRKKELGQIEAEWAYIKNMTDGLENALLNIKKM